MTFSKRNNQENIPDFSSIWYRENDGEPAFSTILPERHRQRMRAKGNRGNHHECFEENVDRRINKLEHANRTLRSEVRGCRKTIEGLRASFRKNETIMREIHHRIRNNLQLVANLLVLQEGKCESPELYEALQESRACIKLIAKFHDTLYMTNNSKSINFVQYVNSIVDSLARLYGRDDIVFIVKNDREIPEKEKMLYIGLIINEIVTNSLKYAFPGKEAGTITIELRKSEPHRYALTIRDNGTGFSSRKESDDYNPVGLKLIESMASLLEGTFIVKRENGTAVIITFP